MSRHLRQQSWAIQQSLTMCKNICEMLCGVPSQAYKATQPSSLGPRRRGTKQRDLMQMVVRGYEGHAHKDRDGDHTHTVSAVGEASLPLPACLPGLTQHKSLI